MYEYAQHGAASPVHLIPEGTEVSLCGRRPMLADAIEWISHEPIADDDPSLCRNCLRQKIRGV